MSNLTALSKVKLPVLYQTSMTDSTFLLVSTVAVEIVGALMIPFQLLSAVIVVNDEISTVTGVVESVVVTFNFISGTVIILLVPEVSVLQDDTLIIASVTSTGIFTSVDLSVILTSVCPVSTFTSPDQFI
jgi:hypothetical protein